jgi:hypothetical protein
MEPLEFWELFQKCVQRIYDPAVLKRKAKRTLQATGSWDAMEFAYQANVNYSTIVRGLPHHQSAKARPIV